MSVTARKRSYGDFEWISIADTAEGKDAVKKREKKRERELDVGYQEELSDRKKESARAKMEQMEKDLAQPPTPPEGGEKGKRSGQSWYSIMRTRWRNFCIQCKKKGFDSLPWDVYKSLWDAAGSLTPPWGGNNTEAYKLQAKYYDTKFRTMLVRWDDDKSYGKGNCGVILVEGYYKVHQNPNLKPSRYEVLSAWETDGRVTDRDGNTVFNIPD